MLAVMEVDKQDVSSYGSITPGKILEDNVTEILGLVKNLLLKKLPATRLLLEDILLSQLFSMWQAK